MLGNRYRIQALSVLGSLHVGRLDFSIQDVISFAQN